MSVHALWVSCDDGGGLDTRTGKKGVHLGEDEMAMTRTGEGRVNPQYALLPADTVDLVSIG